jgi:predicted DNA-binding protein with PD1-like motif
MTLAKPVRPVRVLMGRLAHSEDLLDGLTELCVKEDVRAGRLEAIGAVQRARLAFYDQQAREYQFFELDEPLEITKLSGNVSLKDGKPMVHAHVTLADRAGRAIGGHLAPGTVVFACEFVVEVFEGADFIRGYDQATGLPLWT